MNNQVNQDQLQNQDELKDELESLGLSERQVSAIKNLLTRTFNSKKQRVEKMVQALAPSHLSAGIAMEDIFGTALEIVNRIDVTIDDDGNLITPASSAEQTDGTFQPTGFPPIKDDGCG